MVDIIILLYLAGMFATGFARGTTRQLWSLAVLGLSTFIASHLYIPFSSLTGRYIHDEAGSSLASFVLVFVAVSVVVSWPVDVLFFGSQPKRAADEGITDRLAASVLGIVEAIGMVEVISIMLVTFPVLAWDSWIRTSSLIPKFLSQIAIMMPLLPPQFDLVLKLLR